MATVRESRLPTLAPSQIANEHLPWNVPQAMTATDIRREQDAVGGGRPPRGRGGLRHRLRLRLALVPADAVPLVAHEPAHRRVWRVGREPRAVLAGGDRARPRCDRRPLRDRRAGGGRLVRGDRHRAGGGRRVRARRRPVRRPVGRRHRRRRRRAPHRLRRVAFLRPGLPAGADAVDARRDGKADGRRRPLHRSRPDGRARVERRDRRDRRGSTVDRRPVPARQDPRRAATTRSASASAATSATRGPTTPATSAARRTRRRARSTGAAGIPSGSRRRRTPPRTCSWSAPARPGWSARSCWRSAGSSACTWSMRPRRSAVTSAGCRSCRASATGRACSTGAGSSCGSCAGASR